MFIGVPLHPFPELVLSIRLMLVSRVPFYKYEVDVVQILMLSGIGPTTHLAEHNIPVIAHSPGVGEHLMDHVVVDVALAETSGTSLDFLQPQTSWHFIKLIYGILTYALTGKGPLTTNVCCLYCAVSPRSTTL
jgi:choline dehydrogenase-like flavoprotein